MMTTPVRLKPAASVCLALLVLVLLSGLAFASVASAHHPTTSPPTANQLLLNDGTAGAMLAPTSTTVIADRFNPASASFLTGVTDVKFAADRLRSDVKLWDRIAPPLRMERNGVSWDEYNLLVSGTGFNLAATYNYGVAQGQGRYLNVRVMVPREHWNGRLVFWHHGAADTQILMYTPVIEPELLLSRGWAVAEAQFNGPAPAQQNPNAKDGSYWKSVDEMYKGDPVNYWSYAAHPDWWSNPGGVAISDGATLRNLAGLVKNLLYRETHHQPTSTYWLGWSMAGGAGTAVNTGRDRNGNYTGGDFVVPYDKASGKVFDAFMALEPVYSATAPVDKQFPVAAPYVFVDGNVSTLSLEAPNALNFARKVKAALDGPDADPSLSKNIDDWVRLYTQKYGDHDWTGRFFETMYSGQDRHAVYYDISKPLAERFNTEGHGRKLNWVMSELWRNSPKYLTDWADENLAGWGQLTFSYYQLNDAYHTALFGHLVDWVEHGVTPPTSRIDPVLMDPLATTYPGLPVNDPTQDSLNRPNSSIATNADIAWQRTDPGALTVIPSMVEMPHLTARWGIFTVGYKVQTITPFTPEQLIAGYHVGNIDFAGYADQHSYTHAFSTAVRSLVKQGFYDRAIARQFRHGDRGAPPLPLPQH
jgi:hypothetical protein